MMKTMTTRPHGKKQSLGSLWKQAWTWRWQLKYPLTGNAKEWWIRTATTFKFIRDENHFSEQTMLDLVIWFWTIDSFRDNLPYHPSQTTISPAALKFRLGAFKVWCERYDYARVSKSLSVVQIADSIGKPFESAFPAPWAGATE